MPTKPIGEINGRWSALFRVCLVLVPLTFATLTPWTVWMTANQFADNSFRGEGDRFTQGESAAMMDLLTEQIAREQAEAHVGLRNELINELRLHTREPWHDVMGQRVTALERDQSIVSAEIMSINGKLDSLLVAVTELRSALKNGGDP